MKFKKPKAIELLFITGIIISFVYVFFIRTKAYSWFAKIGVFLLILAILLVNYSIDSRDKAIFSFVSAIVLAILIIFMQVAIYIAPIQPYFFRGIILTIASVAIFILLVYKGIKFWQKKNEKGKEC